MLPYPYADLHIVPELQSLSAAEVSEVRNCYCCIGQSLAVGKGAKPALQPAVHVYSHFAL